MKKYFPKEGLVLALSLPLSGCLPTNESLKIGNTYIERDALKEIGSGLSTIFDTNRDGLITQDEVYQRTEEIEQILDRASRLNSIYSKLEEAFSKDKEKP